MVAYVDETWWSRVATPNLHAWSDAKRPLHLVQQPVASKADEAKALACYGCLVSYELREPGSREEVWLRFVHGQPVSELTTRFLEWSCQKMEQLGKTVLVLIWDNAGWHVSKRVRRWMGEHNRLVKREGRGVRILRCQLPTNSPWLNNIEPHWVHAKRQVAEPGGTLPAQELEARACAYFGVPVLEHLTIAQHAA